MKKYKHIFFLNILFLILSLSLFAQEKNTVEKHIAQSINMILKQDVEQWKKINVRPFKAKTKIDTIKNQTLIVMDFIRGYEAFKDYKHLKLKSIDKVQNSGEHKTEDEMAVEYITAFTMQDSVSKKEYGFIAEDIFLINKKFMGLKLVKAKSLSLTTMDKLWQDYIDGSSVKAQIPVAIIEDSIYSGDWKGEKISLEWKTESAEDQKSYLLRLNQNQKTPVKLQVKTTNHRDYLLLTEPYTGSFILTKSDNLLKGIYYDTEGKQEKIIWIKQK